MHATNNNNSKVEFTKCTTGRIRYIASGKQAKKKYIEEVHQQFNAHDKLNGAQDAFWKMDLKME